MTAKPNTATLARLAGKPGTCGYERAAAMIDSAMRNDAEKVALRGEVARLKARVALLERENDELISRLAAASP